MSESYIFIIGLVLSTILAVLGFLLKTAYQDLKERMVEIKDIGLANDKNITSLELDNVKTKVDINEIKQDQDDIKVELKKMGERVYTLEIRLKDK